ncbi:MAG: S8 family serine peptidase, partial [Lentisphaerae bacterium]|nr:S8 family serine peptidase [Lentisphaerota bacterium]
PHAATNRAASTRGPAARFAGAAVLAEKTAREPATGHTRVVRLLRTDFTYPLIRHERVLAPNPTGGPPRVVREQWAVADHFMVTLRPDAGRADLEALNRARGLHIRRALHTPGLYLVAIPDAGPDALPEAVAAYNRAARVVRYAEPDTILTLDTVFPDDPDFDSLWGLHNTGQTGGVPDADIDAPEAWAHGTGRREIVVGVIDGGVDYLHEDLAANIWTNPGEIPGNKLDDDGNGFVDDVHGYDFINNDGDPMDDLSGTVYGHGTHVAGTIGALGSNGVGVAGVCWNISLLPVKIVDANGYGPLSVAVDAVNYATLMRTRGVNIRLTNNSWGDSDYSLSLSNAIVSAQQAGMLFVCSAGNLYREITPALPYYPSVFPMSNIVSVANTESDDSLRPSSNYGSDCVDLAAPGTGIRSTLRDDLYGPMTGTSMSAPHVSGAAALLWSLKPCADAAEIRQALLDGTEPLPALAGKTVTGGRLNLYRAMTNLTAAIDTTPVGNVLNTTSAFYTVETRIVPATLLDTNRLYFCWNTAGSSAPFTTNRLRRVTNDLFRALIPVQALGSTVYYYVSAHTIAGLHTLSPPGAPGALNTFRVADPVELSVWGWPEDIGAPAPGYGTTVFPSGAVIHAAAPSRVEAGVGARWRADGWQGTGSVPLQGPSNTVTFTLTRPSLLLWHWHRQVALVQDSEPAAFLNATSWWDVPGPAATLEAPGSAELDGGQYRFTGWYVDGVRQPGPTGPCVNPAAGLVMTNARDATAVYLPREQDHDHDRLEDWREYFRFGHTNAEPALRLEPGDVLPFLLPDGASVSRKLTLCNVGDTNVSWTLQRGWFDPVGPGEGAWTHGGPGDAWHVSSARRYSEPYAWYAGTEGDPAQYGNWMDAALTLPPKRLNPGAVLQFRHWIDSELDPDYPGQAYDGGIVEVSTNGGAAFFQVTPEGGYPYLVHEHANSTWTEEIRLFAGTGGWQRAAVDLSAYAGRDAVIRFRFGSDWNTRREGWYIDDVALLNGDDTNAWFQVLPASGTAAPGGSNALSVAVNSLGLPTCTRRGLIRIAADDPLLPTNDVHVLLTVDADPPAAATAVVTLASSPFGRYTLDTNLAAAWSGFYDAPAGIAGYYAALTNGAGTDSGLWTTSLAAVVSGAVPGATNRVYVWARDRVGHIGDAASAALLVLTPGGDYDGDGYTNAHEEIAGTDAADPGSVFGLAGAAAAADGTQRVVVVTWDSVAGRRYALYRGTAVTHSAAVWPPLVTNRPGTGGSMSYTDRVSELPVRFYRLTVSPE